jgi:hypothetical protein
MPVLGRPGLFFRGPTGIQGFLTENPGVVVDPGSQFYSFYSTTGRSHMMDANRGVIVWAAYTPSTTIHSIRAVPFTFVGNTLTVLTSNVLVISLTVGGMAYSTKLSSNKLLVTYAIGGNKARVLTLNPDNTLTAGIENNISPGVTGYAMQLDTVDSTKAIFAYRGDNNFLLSVCSLSVASDVVTANPVTSAAVGSNGIGLATLNNTYSIVGMNNGNFYSVTLNGDNTIALSSAYNFPAVGSSSFIRMARISDTKTLLGMYRAGAGAPIHGSDTYGAEIQTINCNSGVISIDNNGAYAVQAICQPYVCSFTSLDMLTVVNGGGGGQCWLRYTKPTNPISFGNAYLSTGVEEIGRLDDTHAILLYTPSGGVATARVITLS